MMEVLLLLLAYGLLLDCALRKVGVDAGNLPIVVRRRALGGLLRPRPRAVVVLRAAAKASGRGAAAARAARGVPSGGL